MVEHGAGGLQRGAVVLELVIVHLFAFGDRRFDFVGVGVADLVQRATGLDQHPHRNLAGQPGRDLGCVAQLGGRGQEPVQIGGQWADPRFAQQRGQLAFEQVVQPGRRYPASIR